MKRYGEDFKLDQDLLDTIGGYMDDGIREDLHEDMAPCDPADFLCAYLYRDPAFAALLENEFDITVSDAEIVASKIKAADTWDNDLNRQLCELAGMDSEYDAADGSSFEGVVFQAAEKLGVAII